MSQWQPFSFDASTFSGVARLFPLSNMVLFPHVVQPLHIYEPRYRCMMENALADDQLISLALFEPGWESEYENRPPLASVACLGKILTHTQLSDGRYNLLLVGVRRIRIRRELPPTQPFRMAETTLLEDTYTNDCEKHRAEQRAELLEAFRKFVPKSAVANDQFEHLLAQHVSVSILTDIMGYTMNFDYSVKRALLQEVNVDRRVELLLKVLSKGTPAVENSSALGARSFPPDFSPN